MNAALAAYDASREYRSKLIDRAGLQALQSYMRGIALVLIGMNQREKAGENWADTYRDALEWLARARKELTEAGEVYLLPIGKVREEYLKYVDARILTVRGWEARYRAIDSDGNRADFSRSLSSFEESAAVFRELGDYRVATKAAARAADIKCFLATGDARRRLLMEANALYAACGNDHGFDDTSRRLEAEFPGEPRSSTSRIVDEVVLPPAMSQSLQTVKWFAHYSVTEIGRGGMAVVYEARKDDSVVALKTIRKEYVNNVELRERFMREVEISRSLTHPNIVEIFEAGLFQGAPYYTMELIRGESLQTQIGSGKKLPIKLGAEILMQIGGALEYAHLQGIIHRDLKPSNVMLVDGGSMIKVMDFGIAHSALFERMTATGLIVGTPAYMSPARLVGEPATFGDDLYALGLIAYEMITGAAADEWMRRIDEAHVHPRPSEIVSEVPAALDEIVGRLLSRDPKAGYEAARGLLNDLKAFLRAC